MVSTYYYRESNRSKRQGQIVAAMISNFESAEEALKTAQNSAGSAEAEFNRAMDSIEFKSNQLAQTFTGLWQKAVDRETIKSFLDSMISMAEAIDYLVNNPFSKWIIQTSLLTSLVMGLNLAKTKLTAALVKTTIATKIYNQVLLTQELYKLGLITTTQALTGSIIALSKAMWASPFVKVMVVTAGITAIAKVLTWLSQEYDRQAEKVKQLKEEYNELTNTLQENENQYEINIEKIKELNNIKINNGITEQQQEELNILEKQNDALKSQIEYEKILQDIRSRQLGEETLKLSNTKTEVSRERRVRPISDVGMGRYSSIKLTVGEKLDEETTELKKYTDQIIKLNQKKEELKEKLKDTEKQYGIHSKEVKKIVKNIENLEKEETKLKNTRDEIIVGIDELVKKLEEENEGLVGNAKGVQQRRLENEVAIRMAQALVKWSIGSNIQQNNELIESQAELNDYLDFTVEKTEELDDLYKNLTDTIKYINNLNHDYAKNQSLTAEQVEELIQRYPQLTSYIHKTADGWKIEGKALEELNNIREDSVKIAVLAQAGITEASYNNLRERLKLYSIEIESITGADAAIKAMMPYMASGASNETVGAVLKYGKALDLIRGLQEALSDPNYGISKSTSSSKSATEVYQAQVNILYELEEQLRRVNIALERNQILTNLADESEKNQLYNERIGLLRQQQDALHQINEARRKMIRDINNQLSSAGFQIDYNAQLNELMIKNMKHLSNFTDDAAKEYENLIKKVLDLNEANQDSSTKWLQIEQDIESVIESMISLNEANKDVIATVESKIMDIIRKRYEEQGKIREEEYNKEKEVLNNSLNEYKSYVQGMLDEMDRLYNTEDYEKQIQKQSQAIMDIQSDINKLSLAAESGDMDAQTKINDLRKKLDEEREKLVEIQTKRERDLRKQNLQDSIKDYEENTKKQIEILDKEYEDFQSKLDSKLSEENIYLETRKAMMTGRIHAIDDDLETVEYKFEDIETAYINFENRFGEGLSLLGNKIKSEFIDNIQLAKKAILQLQDVTVGSGSIEIEKAKEQIGVLQTLWNTVEDDKKRKEYADEADRLRKKYGLEFEDLRGYTGVYNSNSTTSQISNPSSTLSNLVKNIPKFILNPLDNVVNKIPQYTTKTSSNNNDIKLSLNFPNIIGEMNKSKAGDIANEVFGRFRLELKKLGVQL